MTERGGQVLRALTFFVFGAVLVLGLRTCFVATGDGPSLTEAEAGQGELTIPEAFGAPAAESLVVRGYLFFDEKRGLRFCSFREKGNPPECQEPYLDVEGVDRGAFNFDGKGQDEKLDLEVLYVKETVAMVGTINGRALQVEEILQ